MRTRLRAWSAWVVDREIWVLALGVALATLSARWAPLGLSILAFLWLCRWSSRGRLTLSTPIDWPTYLLLIASLVALVVTTDLWATFTVISRLVAGLALVYGLAHWAQSKAHVALATWGLSGIGAGLALYALIGVAWPVKAMLPFASKLFYARMPARVGDTVNANIMAGALAMLLPFPLALCVLARPDDLPRTGRLVPRWLADVLDARWFRRVGFGGAALSIAVTTVLTQSRGAWAAALVGLCVILARRWRWLGWLLPLALVGAGVILWQYGIPVLLDPVVRGGIAGRSSALSSWEGRVEIWSRALFMIQDFPFTGIGAGTFDAVADTLYPFFLVGPEAQISHAHNLLLQVAVDLGIPGLVAYVSVLVVAFRCAVRATAAYARTGVAHPRRARRSGRALAAVSWAGLASLVAMSVHGLVDVTTWITGRSAFVPWLVIGVLIALVQGPKPGTPDPLERAHG